MKKIALIYDYDGTLAYGNIQEPALLPFLLNANETINDFWRASNSNNQYSNSAQSYCESILERARQKRLALTREFLFECGKKSKLYPGTRGWFKRINQFASQYDVEVEHYIISSGNKELLIGSPLASFFKEIYGCEFLFRYNEATQCAVFIDDAAKINYLSRIHETGIPYTSMLYFGDGLSDLGAMTHVTAMGGYTIGIFQKNLDNIKRLESKGILKFSFDAKRCYLNDSTMEKAVKAIIIEMISEQLSLFDE